MRGQVEDAGRLRPDSVPVGVPKAKVCRLLTRCATLKVAPGPNYGRNRVLTPGGRRPSTPPCALTIKFSGPRLGYSGLSEGS